MTMTDSLAISIPTLLAIFGFIISLIKIIDTDGISFFRTVSEMLSNKEEKILIANFSSIDLSLQLLIISMHLWNLTLIKSAIYLITSKYKPSLLLK